MLLILRSAYCPADTAPGHHFILVGVACPDEGHPSFKPAVEVLVTLEPGYREGLWEVNLVHSRSDSSHYPYLN